MTEFQFLGIAIFETVVLDASNKHWRKSCVTFMHNHNMEDVACLVFQFFASLFQLFVIPTMSHRNRKS